MSSHDGETSAGWADAWMIPARYSGPNLPDVNRRITQVLAAWTAPVPGGWQRGRDARLHNPSSRYQRARHTTSTPRSGSEHELEFQILNDDPAVVRTLCEDAVVVDGINAVPLARGTTGGRRGNVEADMLLLTHDTIGYRQWLTEVKTGSNNAWFAVIESLRQLKLFQLSDAAQAIMPARHPDVPAQTPVTALVLAPATFYTAPGAKQRSVKPAQQLIDAIIPAASIDIRLATWDLSTRTIRRLKP